MGEHVRGSDAGEHVSRSERDDQSPAPDVANRAIAATYDRFAAPYDRFVSPLAGGTRQGALDLLAPTAGDRVLELGSGPGHALVALAERVGDEGQVVGLDAAPAMARRGRARVERAGLGDRVAVVLADARDLPLPDGSVDAVFVEDTLELFDAGEQQVVLAEARRVLRDGGRLGVVTMERAGAERSAFVRAYDWAFAHVPGYERFGCRPIYAREALEAAGFAVESAEQHRRALVWPVEVLVATADPA